MSLFHVKEFERDDDPEYPATDYCKPTDHCFRCGEVLDDDLWFSWMAVTMRDVGIWRFGCM